jgi:hypothetical protein
MWAVKKTIPRHAEYVRGMPKRLKKTINWTYLHANMIAHGIMMVAPRGWRL